MSEEQVADVSVEEVAPSVANDDWRTSVPEEIRGPRGNSRRRLLLWHARGTRTGPRSHGHIVKYGTV